MPGRTRATKKTAKSAPLAEYNAKRDFSRTAEPAGKVPKPRGKRLHFVIQKHAASRLHCAHGRNVARRLRYPAGVFSNGSRRR